MRAAAPPSPARRAWTSDRLGWIVTAGLILATGLALFGDGLLFVARQWADPEYSHGWLIPLVTLFVLWSRREAILAEARGGAWLGAALVGLALALLLFSEMAFIRRGPFLALVPTLIGLGLAALGGRAMRHALLPLLFLLFAFPLPGSVAVPLSTQLQLVSSHLGAFMLQALGISVFLDGNIIDLGVYKLQVAEACSGLRYLFPLGAFGFLCAWMYRGPFWARALILLSVVPITIATNSARIALTGLFIEHGSIALAEGFMHLFEGWVIFLIALLILFALMWLLARLLGGRPGLLDLLDFDRLGGGVRPAAAGTGRLPALPLSLPLPLVACAGLMLAAALAQGPLTNRQQVVPERPPLVTFPLALDGWQGRPIPIDDPAVLRSLGASDHLLADFTAGAAPPVNLWVAYYGEQLGNAAIHSPKDCLPGAGWEYASLTTTQAPATGADGRPFAINRGLIANGTSQMLIYYWLDIRGRKVTSDLALKLYNLWDSYALGRSDGALIRVLTAVAPGESVEQADARARGFIASAYPHLRPFVGR